MDASEVTRVEEGEGVGLDDARQGQCAQDQRDEKTSQGVDERGRHRSDVGTRPAPAPDRGHEGSIRAARCLFELPSQDSLRG